jgi:hypothetical protein
MSLFIRRVTAKPTASLALVLQVLCVAASFSWGCLAVRPSNGGGQTSFTPPRLIEPSDVALPPGYKIEAVAQGLTFPSGVTFDEAGRVYVIEAGYSYGEVWTVPRLLRIEPDRAPTVVATGDKNGRGPESRFTKASFMLPRVES